jgi:hypothetical protein
MAELPFTLADHAVAEELLADPVLARADGLGFDVKYRCSGAGVRELGTQLFAFTPTVGGG